MNKIFYLLFALFALQSSPASAFDEEEYKAYAENIRKQVWESNLPEFKKPKTTDRFNNYPAVSLACYEELTFNKQEGSFFVKDQRYTTHLNRHMVQINDETALQSFSEFDVKAYSKYGDLLFGKKEMFYILGVRVIKPDGTVHEVGTDDYVLAAEGRKNRDGRQRLAVPNLAIGDIIDFFTYRYQDEPQGGIFSYSFYYIDRYPMLSYRVHCEIPFEMAVRYRTLNGAPDFERTMSDNCYALDVRVKDVERTEPELWYNYNVLSPHAILEFNDEMSSPIIKYTTQKGLQDNPNPRLYQADAWASWANTGMGVTKKDKEAIAEAVRLYADQEQRADYLYEHCAVYLLSNRLRDFNEDTFAPWLAELFKKAGIDYQCGITTNDKFEPMESLISYWHVTRFLRLPNGKCYFPPYFACWPGEVPHQFQGRQAVVCINQKNKLKQGPYQQIYLPKTTVDDNAYHYTIKAQVDGTQMRINSISTLTGAMRQDASLVMPTRDEIVRSYSKKHEKMTSRGSLYNAKYADIIKEGDANDIEEQKEFIRSAIAAYHDAEPSSVGDCRVLTVGTTDEEPALSFQTSYTMDDMVKRAGNNLILSVGMLLGSELKIEGRERERTADVIRIAPSSYTWDIEVALPEGYQISPESVHALQTSFSNDCGSFTVKATAEDGKLLLKAEKRVLHKRESVDKWPQLLALYDHSYNYLSQQIILKR